MDVDLGRGLVAQLEVALDEQLTLLVVSAEHHGPHQVQLAVGPHQPLHLLVLGLDGLVRLDPGQDLAQPLLFVTLAQRRVDLADERFDAVDLVVKTITMMAPSLVSFGNLLEDRQRHLWVN